MKYHSCYLSILICAIPFLASGSGWIKRVGTTSTTITGSVFVELDNDTTFAISGTTGSRLFLGKFNKSQSSVSGRTFHKTSGYEETGALLPSRFNREYWGMGQSPGYHTLIFKADSTGRIRFCKFYSVSGDGYLESQRMHELADGDLIVSTGHSVLRIDSSGTLLWSKCTSDMYQIYNRAILPLSDSRFLVAGSMNDGVAWNSFQDFFLQCFDTSGNVLWTTTYGNNGNDYAVAATLSANGRIYIGGYHSISTFVRESVLACFDTSGNLLWNKLYPSTEGIEDLKAIAGNKLAILTEVNAFFPADSIVRYSILDAQGNLLQSQILFGGNNFIPTADSAVCFSLRKSTGHYLVKLDGLRFPQCLDPVPDWFYWRTEDWQSVNHPSFSFSSTTLSAYTGTDSTNSVSLFSFCQSSCAVRALFASSTVQPCQNTTVAFTNESSGATQYAWKVNDDSLSAATTFQHTFTSPGNHRITLIAKNGACLDSMTVVLHVNATPVSSFQVSVTNRLIDCMADSTMHDKYSWDFGDGVSYLGADTAQHSFDQSDTYTVCLTAYNSCGNTLSCQQVTTGPTASNSFRRIISHSILNGTFRPYKMVEVADGGFYCVGTSNYVDDDPHVSRLAADGKPVRDMQINGGPSGIGNGNYQIERISLAGDGSLYYAGRNESAKIFYGRMDGAWSPWNRSFEASGSNSIMGGIAEFKNKNFILGCGRNGVGVLMMHNRWGDTLWARGYFGIQGIRGLELDGDSCAVALGVHTSFTGMSLFKVDHDGHVLWSYKYTDSASTLNSVAQLLKTRDGNYLIAGSNDGKGTLLKVDSAGAVLWSRKYATSIVWQVTELPDGSLYFITSLPGYGAICHTDSLGNVLNAWRSDHGFGALVATSDTGVLVGGNLYSPSPSDQHFEIIKFNRNGLTPCGVDTASVSPLPSAYVRSAYATSSQYVGNPIVLLTNWLVQSLTVRDTMPCYSSVASLMTRFSGDSVCTGTPLQFVNQSTGPIASYDWNFNGGNPDSSSLENPIATWNVPGPYLVSLVASDSSGNQSIFSKEVAVLPLPHVQANDKTICGSGQVSLTATGWGYQTITWSPATGLSTTTGTQTVASPTQTTVYTITATSAFGCVKDTTVTVRVVPVPVVGFQPDDTVCVNQLNTFQPSGASSYAWYVNGMLIGSTTGSFSYHVSGSPFTLRVIGTDSSSCKDTLTITLVVDTCVVSSTVDIDKRIQIYPSPVRNKLYIDNLELLGHPGFRLFDLAGRMVMDLISIASPVDLSDLSPGCYFLELRDKQGLLMTQKIIKQ